MSTAKKVYDKVSGAELGEKLDEVVTTCIQSNTYGFNMKRTFTYEGKEYDVIVKMDIYAASEADCPSAPRVRHRRYSSEF